MEEQLKYLKKIIPEQLEVFVRRYEVLNTIFLSGTSGRRAVSDRLGLSERTVRSETDRLSEEGLISVAKGGMSVTEEGQAVLASLKSLTHSLLGLTILEKEIAFLLGVREVFIVQGNCDEDEMVKKEIGAAAAKILLRCTTVESTIALTGGSTMAWVVENIPFSQSRQAGIIVPARGSVGHKVEQQSDTLVSKLAERMHAQYRLLNIPDSMSSKAMNEIKNEPAVQEALWQMQKADLLAFGIGNALHMAKKRHVSDSVFEYLVRKNAIAEAFGYYINADGEIIYSTRSLSFNLDDIQKIPCVIAVAGGRNKAAAILAVSRILKDAIMVMDEGAAEELLLLKKKLVAVE